MSPHSSGKQSTQASQVVAQPSSKQDAASFTQSSPASQSDTPEQATVFPTWNLSNRSGDHVTFGIALYQARAANKVEGAAFLKGQSCASELMKAGIDLDRVVALPAIITGKVESSLGVNITMALGSVMSVVQQSTDQPLLDSGDTAVWVSKESAGTCNADRTNAYQVRTWNLQAGIGTRWLWTGWILFPGVTPNDPEGAASDAHRAVFTFNDVMLSDQLAEIDSISDDPAITCGQATGLKPVELDAVLAAGCVRD